MKYGIYFAYWAKEWDADYKRYIDRAARLGFDILEISCASLKHTYVTDQQLYDLKEYAKSKNIMLTAGYGPAPEENLGSADPAVQKHALAFFTDILHKLQKLDITVCGGGLYSYWPVDYTKPIDKAGDLDRSIRNMRELAKVAEDCNVTLGMEVLNRFEGYLLNSCEEAVAYVDAVGSDHVRVMLDTFHMNIEENNIGDAIRRAGSRLGHFHLGEQNRLVPGKGSLPWNEIGQALRDIDYRGYAVMEPFVLPGGGIGSDIKVWRNMITDCSEEAMDRDAAGALSFVKHVFER